MIPKNRWLRRFLVILMVAVVTSGFAVFSDYLAQAKPNHGLPSALSSVRLLPDFPSALAQAAPQPGATSGKAGSQSQKTPDQNNQPQSPEQDKKSLLTEQEKKSLLSERSIVTISIGVLLAVVVLLVMLLSPIVGTLDKATLQEKGSFLSEAFPSVLQGVTVLLIVMIVALLTLVRVINEQGSISILSALIGYVLGKRATELEYQQPPVAASEAKPTDFKITPATNQVIAGQEVVIAIVPPQTVDTNIQLEPANTGTARVRDRAAIVFAAPTDAAGKTVTITATSTDNPSLKSAQATIAILPSTS